MDHLAARFRRNNKKESAASPHDPPSPERKPVLPSLVIASAASTRTTTPPGSIQTGNIIMPKSPLRGLSNIRLAHKRGRSPGLPQFPLPNIMSAMSPISNPPTTANANQGVTYVANVRRPQLPPFLQISDSTIAQRFQEIIWLERLRTQQSAQNLSPNFRFARVLPPESKILDRYANIQPWTNNRVRLAVPQGKPDYINASPIVCPSPLRPTMRPNYRYIAMQGPKANTVEHTWRMISQLENPAVIVMLTETHDGPMEKCYPYFPGDFHIERIEIGEADEFGDGFRAHVKCVSLEERQDGAIQMRKLTLHVDGRGDMTVWHLLYRKWPDFGVPKTEDHASFLELMKLSRELNTSIVNPRIIHCSAGVGRTGTFIALETLMREVDEGAMDYLDPTKNDNNDDLIFQTVNHLREQRRTMVQADSQYNFIYKVLRRRWLERHGLLNESAEGERASKRKHNPILRTTTFGQVRGARRVSQTSQTSQTSQPPDNDSSDDSTPGGAPLHYTGN